MTPPAARQPGEGAAHRISERDILRALQYGPERLAEHKPLELWDYELPGMVAWINSLLAAEYQRGVEEVLALLNPRQHAIMTFDELRQQARALIPGEEAQS